MDPDNMLPENYSEECIEWFKGTVVEEFTGDRRRDVVADMAKDYFQALNQATFTPKQSERTPDSKVISITQNTFGISQDEARARLYALAKKRGVTPLTGKVHFTARACYMEVK